jgi:hypothetical protein
MLGRVEHRGVIERSLGNNGFREPYAAPTGPDDVAEEDNVEDKVEVGEVVGGDGRVRVEGRVDDIVEGSA